MAAGIIVTKRITEGPRDMKMHASCQKKNGIHYTPPSLAAFLAERVVAFAPLDKLDLIVLDPACGDGVLLRALAEAVPTEVRKRLKLIGYDTDRSAAEKCSEALSDLPVDRVDIRISDFLEADTIAGRKQTYLFDDESDVVVGADIVISNPPYVRTQVLGSREARRLAEQFGLGGRVDLYQAFTAAMITALKPGGVLGLLTSNRFIFTKAGKSMRRFLQQKLQLHQLIDLGDTKLFDAAVLPAILVGTTHEEGTAGACRFSRAYEDNSSIRREDVPVFPSVLDALRAQHTGALATPGGDYIVEQGSLGTGRNSSEPWFLLTPELDDWMATVLSRTHCLFGEIAEVKVGIKTTADSVFIRDDWDNLDEDMRPEADLLHPLLTHHVAEQWRLSTPISQVRKRVLYPHEVRSGRRLPIDLGQYPNAQRYLQSHRATLAARDYLVDSGRKWYEIWVPQDPRRWQTPKLVWPDISVRPCFYVDYEGAIVNGDCYWLTLRAGAEGDMLLLLLAVANSAFAEKFYDARFHNKLYSGRRRFITQYVKEFPVPDPSTAAAKRILEVTRRILHAGELAERHSLGQMVDNAVWEAFGLTEETTR